MSALHSILSGPLFPGVGEATARKLERHFGVSLSAVLKKQDARALSVVVTERKAELVMQGWRSYAAKREITDWLDPPKLLPRAEVFYCVTYGLS